MQPMALILPNVTSLLPKRNVTLPGLLEEACKAKRVFEIVYVTPEI